MEEENSKNSYISNLSSLTKTEKRPKLVDNKSTNKSSNNSEKDQKKSNATNNADKK